MTEKTLSEKIATYLTMQHKSVLFRFDVGADIRLSIGQAKRIKYKLLHKVGHPDMFIAEMRNGYGGLYIELKKNKEEVYKIDGGYKKNKHLSEQLAYHKLLEDKGYKVVFGLGFNDTVSKINEYLKEN